MNRSLDRCQLSLVFRDFQPFQLSISKGQIAINRCVVRTRTWKCRVQDQTLCLLAERPMYSRVLQLCTWRGRNEVKTPRRLAWGSTDPSSPSLKLFLACNNRFILQIHTVAIDAFPQHMLVAYFFPSETGLSPRIIWCWHLSCCDFKASHDTCWATCTSASCKK